MKKDKHKDRQCVDGISFTEIFDGLKRRLVGVKAVAMAVIAFDDILTQDCDEEEPFDEKLLLEVCDKIRQRTRTETELLRVGYRQFLLIHCGIGNAMQLESLGRSILNAMEEPYYHQQYLRYITASVGLSFGSIDKTPLPTLFRRAELAMATARRRGRNHFEIYRSQTAVASRYNEQKLLQDLPAALEKGEIYYVYQPQYDASAQVYTGAEMLARWEHPELGTVPPGVFIPLAEQSGMIVPLLHHQLIEASRSFDRFRQMEMPHFSLSINLSPYVLFQRDFIESVSFFLESYALEHKPLIFEISEQMIAHNSDYLASVLDQLLDMGISLEIDDFGTGYTSLNALINFPIERLKTDKSLLKGIETQQRKRDLLHAIHAMTSSLQIGLVVEGVENVGEYDVVASLGDIVVQGFHLARPIPFSQLMQTLQEQ